VNIVLEDAEADDRATSGIALSAGDGLCRRTYDSPGL
jgi:hypothetical protein